MAGIHPTFIQDGPALSNTFLADDLLRSYLQNVLPEAHKSSIESDLKKFGERCASELMTLANEAEAQPPTLVSFDPWGKRVDEIKTSAAWSKLHEVAAQEGLIAIGYDRKQNEFSRVYQFAKLYLFHPSSAFVTCPLAMTDGAARVLELMARPEMKAKAFTALTSRDATKAWTSGQWMTEKTGGSDVSGTSTVAKKTIEGYELFGDKWFTSATTAQMCLALAKVEGAIDKREGLSLFYVELRDEKSQLKNIRINRLKDKLGTKALPTAELTLEGTPANLIGEIGEGVKTISSLLNITRLYNSVTAIGSMARALMLAKDYAQKRSAFGKKLADHTLHLQTLADLTAEHEATFHLVFHCIELLGREEVNSATEEERTLLRLLTPITKLWSGKQATMIASEVLESFGGAGYIEDTGLPRLLRDAQVFSIWEGTTNVLSLDTLRAMAKEKALLPYYDVIEAKLRNLKSSDLFAERELVREALKEMKLYVASSATLKTEEQQAGARAFAMALGRTFAGTLLLEFAETTSQVRPRAKSIAKRFFKKPLTALVSIEDHSLEALKALVFN